MVGGQKGLDEIQELSHEMLRQRFEAETKRELKIYGRSFNRRYPGGNPGNHTHQDVASGRYKMAEFAADLFQVITGKAEAGIPP